MPGWTLTETHPAHGRTFRRPLSTIEVALFWDGRFNGTEDAIHHAELRLLNPSGDARLFSDANVVKAWLSTKRRHPLAGAAVRLLPGDSALASPHFVVRERDLAALRPDEVVFGRVTGTAELAQRRTAIVGGPRVLSDDLLARLYVFRETDPKRTDTLHLMVMLAHCVTDEMANRTFLRCLFDTLARGPGSELAQMPLEERLATIVPCADLAPVHLRSLSPARRRWRRAVARVICQLRAERSHGGHTLPCRRTDATPYTPARPGLVTTSLTEAQTSAVLSNCRKHGVTFGNAYLALGQVAMTRVLYRRYLRGDISEDEWAYRKRQPHRICATLSLRQHINEGWFEGGGGGEFMVAISTFSYRLPFMTLCDGHRERDLSDGAPPFGDLLPFERFLHRARLIKEQVKANFSHPLFFELSDASTLAYAQHTYDCAIQWAKRVGGADNDDADKERTLATSDLLSDVNAYDGCTLGDLDLISPHEHPLPPSHPLSPFSPDPHPNRAGYVTPPPATEVAPSVAVEDITTILRVRPADVYLSALTSRGRLKMYVYYDRNVFEDGVVREWLDEVRGATLWYLGRAHASPRGAPRAKM